MIKQIFYFILFISVFNAAAQSVSKDTLLPTVTPTTTIAPTETVQPSITTSTTATTPTETVQIAPTQTLQPVTITTQTLHPTMPNIKHRRKPNETFKKENEEIAKLYKQPFDRKAEIVLQNKRFRIYNNYVTFGLGVCYNSGWNRSQQATQLDYNFHVKRNRFQAGFLLAGPGFRDNNLVQLHVGMGYRFERCNYHWAVYGGVSYSQGYRLLTGYLQNPDTIYKSEFHAIGGYANIACYYKLKFDYGIGASAFIDANSKQYLVGIKVELFLSGAFKGLKKINYAKEEAKER